jgi:hypothetical protein
LLDLACLVEFHFPFSCNPVVTLHVSCLACRTTVPGGDVPSPGRGRVSRVRGHRHCTVVVHVAQRGRETRSSSDRVVAGDELRPMYLHNKRQEKKTRKAAAVVQRKTIAFYYPVHCVCCMRPVIALRRSPAFQSAAGVGGHRRLQHGLWTASARGAQAPS